MDLYNLVVSAKITKGGGGDEPVLINKTINENGVYNASSDSADGYKNVTVSVPIPSGYIQPTGTSSITTNGIYDITNFASVDVNVSGGGGGGDTDIEDGLIKGNLSGSYTNNRVDRIRAYAFNSFGSLTAVDFPNVTVIQASAFANCSKLATINFPNLVSIHSSAFNNCSSLATISLPKVTNIQANAFGRCSVLMSAYFLGSSIISLYSSTAFGSTPMTNSTYTGSFGSIYVPASLVDSYKVASAWSYYAARITSYVE